MHRAEEIKTFEEDDHFKEDVVAEDISSCLQPLLLLLGEEERTLLQKVDMEGKSQKTLAKEQGVSYPTVKSKVQRARKKLKGLLLACCKERIGEFKGSDGCC